MDKEHYNRWIDQTLEPEEEASMAAALAEEPALAKEMEDVRALGDLLRAEVPASVEPPHPDFFNHLIVSKVEREMRLGAQKPAKKAWWARLGYAWMPASALTAVLAFFAGAKMSSSPEQQVIALSTPPSSPQVYTIGEDYEAQVIADEGGQVEVIVMSGLADLRDDLDLTASFSVTDSDKLGMAVLNQF